MQLRCSSVFGEDAGRHFIGKIAGAGKIAESFPPVEEEPGFAARRNNHFIRPEKKSEAEEAARNRWMNFRSARGDPTPAIQR